MTRDLSPEPRTVAVLALLVALLVVFTGCTESNTRSEQQKDAQTDRHETITVSGTVSVPLPQGGALPVPVNLTIERNGSETKSEVSHESSQTKTQMDGAAIAQQLGAVVGKTMDAAISRLTGFQIGPTQPANPLGGVGDLTKEVLLLAGAAYAAHQRGKSNQLEQERDFHRNDADQAYKKLDARQGSPS